MSQETSSASPKARKFARELGVDITQVMGSEKDGRVIEDDIKKFVSSNQKTSMKLKMIRQIKLKMNLSIQILEKSKLKIFQE